MKKLITPLIISLALWAIIILAGSHVFAASVKMGDTVYSNEPVIYLDCSKVGSVTIEDGTELIGNVMIITLADGTELKGKMRFRIQNQDTSEWTEWPEYQDYDPAATITTNITPNVKYLIQGQFCDIFENCMNQGQLLITDDFFQHVNEFGGTGTITIETEFTVNVNNN
jgi:hypothetical protein